MEIIKINKTLDNNNELGGTTMSWWRLIPHPHYGNFGGATNLGSRNERPIDWMDSLFKKHDNQLKNARTLAQTRKADYNLLINLKKGNKKVLARPIYGRIYRILSISVFTIICAVT